jgi:hypothetical protein
LRVECAAVAGEANHIAATKNTTANAARICLAVTAKSQEVAAGVLITDHVRTNLKNQLVAGIELEQLRLAGIGALECPEISFRVGEDGTIRSIRAVSRLA